jgi:formylglycine-generating enzyme required for sulfatase activity
VRHRHLAAAAVVCLAALALYLFTNRGSMGYREWLSAKAGHRYRLLTDAEWEYAARARSAAPYPWGTSASHRFANYGGPDCPPCVGVVSDADRWENTAPVGSFPPNAFGLHDTSGNVYEWVEDCHDAEPRPSDGSAAVADGCTKHTLRGGAWYSNPERVTSSYRAWQTPDKRDRVVGFRVAREL